MLESNSPESSMKDCRPDPEEELQRARKRKEGINSCLDAIKLTSNASVHLSQKQKEGLCEIIGVLIIEIWQIDKQTERWLSEIDK